MLTASVGSEQIETRGARLCNLLSPMFEAVPQAGAQLGPVGPRTVIGFCPHKLEMAKGRRGCLTDTLADP